MRYKIREETTMDSSDLVELPDGAIPISIEKHYRLETHDGLILDVEHWEIVYLTPFVE